MEYTHVVGGDHWRSEVMDALGNVGGAVLDDSIGVAYTWDAWGRNMSTTWDNAEVLGWKGLQAPSAYVPASGLIYMRARWYDPALGRFLSEDPAGLSGGINPYVFAGDDPINGSDPSGLLQQDCTTYEDNAGIHITCDKSPSGGGGISISLDSFFGGGSPLWMQGSNPAMAFFGQLTGLRVNETNKGGLKNVSTALGGFGVAAGISEVAGAGKRIGSNFHVYSPNFFANQYVTTADLAEVGRSAGSVFFVVGVAVDWASVGHGETFGEFVANTGVGLTATLIGGVPGAVVGGVYFGVGHTLGWSNVLGNSDCSFAAGKGIPCP